MGSFRSDDLPPPSSPKSLIGNPNVFKTMDPGLKIAGVTMRWESMLLLFPLVFVFMLSSFQGVMRGLAPSWYFSVIPEIFNRESKLLLLLLIFKYFEPLIEAFRGDKQG